jgi:hypothetical protein
MANYSTLAIALCSVLTTTSFADWHADADNSTVIAFSDSAEVSSGTDRVLASASVSFNSETECAPLFALINTFPAKPRQKNSTGTVPIPMQLYVDGKQHASWRTTITSSNNRTVVLANSLSAPALIALAEGSVVKIVIDNDRKAFAMFKLTGSKAAISEALASCLVAQ